MVNSASLNFGPDNIKENLSVHALQYLLYKLVGPGRQLSNDCTPEKLLPNYIACTEEHGGMRFLPRGVRAVPSHRVSRKGKPKELEKQVLLRGWRLLSSVFLHLLS